MIRAIITAMAEGVIKRFSAKGRPGETFTNREYLQHYGFSSAPLAGAEAILIKSGNHIVMIASDDRRYRIAVAGGEVAIYTDEGDCIHLKRGRLVEIVTETLVVKAATKVRFETPLVEATGEIIDRVESGGRSMHGMREVYDGHTHGGIDPGDGTTATPGQEM
jgi:phage gp45-like